MVTRETKRLVFWSSFVALTAWPVVAWAQSTSATITKHGSEIDIRSSGRIVAEALRDGSILLEAASPPSTGFETTAAQIQPRGENTQVNDAALDYVELLPSRRPFVNATQSETSVAAFGQNIVVAYNSSAGFHHSIGPGVFYDRIRFTGYSVSNDGGNTWRNGFVPPAAGAWGTFGDPSIGADRHGVFYLAHLGVDANFGDGGQFLVQVNRSTDGGISWDEGAVLQVDNGNDKNWLAVGPDPIHRNRDNIYVTWSSFQPGRTELRFASSADGGSTWAVKTIFVPTANPDPTKPQARLQFSNPVVDRVTGTLYVPFERYSFADQDFIQMLVSDDAGESFRLATFDIPGAPDRTLIPVTEVGELTSCGTNNLRLTIHAGGDAGPGQFGRPRWVNASRMVLQPALAAHNGVVYLVWHNSTSPQFGDPAASSNILLVRSLDGGETWSAPIRINPPDATDRHHVLPAIAVGDNPFSVHVSYYTQHVDGTIDLDVVNSQDGAVTFPPQRTIRVTTTPMNLPPTNIPLTGAPTFASTNYDRTVVSCYALGEYQSVTAANGSVYAAWGDTRNEITQPVHPLDPISGQTHPQEDVFLQEIKAQ